MSFEKIFAPRVSFRFKLEGRASVKGSSPVIRFLTVYFINCKFTFISDNFINSTRA